MPVFNGTIRLEEGDGLVHAGRRLVGEADDEREDDRNAVSSAVFGAVEYLFELDVLLDAPEHLIGPGLHANQQPAQAGTVKAKMLVLNGADDPFVPKEQVDGFEKEMKAAGVDYRLVNYPGGKHAFTNPGATERGKKFNLPLEYNADIDKKSWTEAEAFLKRVLA